MLYRWATQYYIWLLRQTQCCKVAGRSRWCELGLVLCVRRKLVANIEIEVITCPLTWGLSCMDWTSTYQWQTRNNKATWVSTRQRQKKVDRVEGRKVEARRVGGMGELWIESMYMASFVSLNQAQSVWWCWSRQGRVAWRRQQSWVTMSFGPLTSKGVVLRWRSGHSLPELKSYRTSERDGYASLQQTT